MNFALPLCGGSYPLWDWDASEVVHAWEFGFAPAARHLEGMNELLAAMPKAAEAGVGRGLTVERPLIANRPGPPTPTRLDSCLTSNEGLASLHATHRPSP